MFCSSTKFAARPRVHRAVSSQPRAPIRSTLDARKSQRKPRQTFALPDLADAAAGVPQNVMEIGYTLPVLPVPEVVWQAMPAVAAAWVIWLFTTGSQKRNQLKRKLTEQGYNVKAFERLDELRYFEKAAQEGRIQEALDKIWYNKLFGSAAYGSMAGVKNAKEYWASRGENVTTLGDLNKLKSKLAKKYPSLTEKGGGLKK